MTKIQKQINFAIKASTAAAAKLTEVGMKVIVTRDDGVELSTVTRSMPWALGHGVMVVKVEGISGGYDCERVRPA